MAAESTRGVGYVLLAAVGFGTLGVFGDRALATGLPLGTLLSFRFAIAAVFVFAALSVRGGRVTLPVRAAAANLTLGWLYALMTICYFLSLRWLTVGVASLVLYTYPVPVFVVSAAVLGEAVTRRKLVALASALSGVGVIVGADVAGVAPTGVALGAAAAGAYALYLVGSRALSGTATSASRAGYNFLGSTMCLLCYAATIGRLTLPAGPTEWGLVAGIGIFGTVVPIGLLIVGLNRIDASRASVVGTVEPLTAVALGVVLLGEPLTASIAAGGGLVILGVVIANGG